MSESTKTARLISFNSHDAATNMAIDEAILEAHKQGLVPATLRLYQFAPPAVSLGYLQDLPKEIAEGITGRGLEIVRRPTGGRAVLHLNDLTYSFVGSSLMKESNNGGQAPVYGASLSASITVAYRQICQALILSMAQFGIPIEMGLGTASNRGEHDCFAATTNADLHYQGKKLIGSAQVRRKHAILQHGSILLNQPQQAMAELIAVQTQAKEANTLKTKGDTRHANLFDIAKRQIPIAELEEALKNGFEKNFAVTFRHSQLSEQELRLAHELRPKYLFITRSV